jgi:heterodisulfide reductase subunit B
MMAAYAYYPGCSLEHSAASYDRSIRAVFAALGVELREIPDWNCCGATMYMSVKKVVGYAISARNLALAQEMQLDVCAPCSSCYTILRKTNRHMASDPKRREKINLALEAAHLHYDGGVKVRHPLDILVNDIGIEKIRDAVKVPLAGLRVAPYYGCQIVRPHGYFDDRDDPMSMDRLFAALGAEVVPYPPKVRCCGGMLMTTEEEVGRKLTHSLLTAAEENGAEIIATACPLCQINLEVYQDEINQAFDTRFAIPVVYFSHLVGIALGLSPASLGMESFLIPPKTLLARAEEVTA